MAGGLGQHIDRTHAALEDLRARVGEARTGVLAEALEELTNTLEELEVTSEELAAQNEELRGSQDELAAQRRAYEELFEFAPEPYVVTDGDGVIRRANRAASVLLEARPERLAGRPLALFVPLDDRPAFRRRLLRLAAGKPDERWEFTLQPRGRAAVTVAALVRPATDRSGSRRMLRWMLRDVTESRRAQAALQQAFSRTAEEVEHLRDLDQWKDAFLAAAAHDLRAPLRAIDATAGALAGGGPVEEAAERIRLQVGRLDQLITDLLDLDRFTRGSVRAERHPTDVKGLVQRVVDDVRSDSHPVDVRADAITANLDASRVAQIVANLLRNAVAHTPAGTPVHVRVSGDADRVVLVVEDEGPGVPEEIRDVLFSPFVTRPAHGDAPAGTGIGLTLVHLFAEIHGGTARYEDRPGGGARFVVELRGGRDRRPRPR